MKFPEPIVFGSRFRKRFLDVVGKSAVRRISFFSLSDGDCLTVKGVRVRCLGPRSVGKLSGVRVDFLHADWWAVSTKQTLTLFVGELDGTEVHVLSKLLDNVSNVDDLILPSYGGIKSLQSHNLSYPKQLQDEISILALKEKKKGRRVYALPHPVSPSWADAVAVFV
ncbi:MAG: hypothetical protein QXI42_11100 [Thermoproteota archaeon]